MCASGIKTYPLSTGPRRCVVEAQFVLKNEIVRWRGTVRAARHLSLEKPCVQCASNSATCTRMPGVSSNSVLSRSSGLKINYLEGYDIYR